MLIRSSIRLALCTLLISATAQAQEMRAYVGALKLQEANFSHFDGKRASYCSLRYGSPRWREEHGRSLDKLRGTRIRFGKDSWAQLELNTPATLGGKALAPGFYCLLFDLSVDGDWSLVLLDAAEMRRRSLHAFGSARIEGIGELFPLRSKPAQEPSAEFVVSFHADAKDPAKAELRIRFGPMQLSADLRVDLEQAPKIEFPSAGR